VNSLISRYAVIVIILTVLAIIVFAGFHVTGHSDANSLCLLTVCAFILSSVGVSVLLGVNPLLIQTSANNGVSIPFRLERPPRI
jgi:hypothetical protein